MKARANCILCLRCNKCIHSKYVGVKGLTPNILRNFACSKCECNIGELEQEEKFCNKVETPIHTIG